MDITEKSAGWSAANVTSDSRGKWQGGGGGMQATRIHKEVPTSPPPKRNLAELP